MIENFVYRDAPGYRRVRRVAEIVLSLIVLIAAAPVIAAACLAIVIDDPGPVFFVQTRIGRFNRPFRMFKLRTMRVAECRDAPSPKGPGDSRITRVGRVLRKASIDELPQLLNVLRGEMSLVGPRPEMPFLVERYEPWQHLRHLVPPGITCIWQVECRSTIPLDNPKSTLMDLEYIRRASLAFDATLLVKTVAATFSTRGSF